MADENTSTEDLQQQTTEGQDVFNADASQSNNDGGTQPTVDDKAKINEAATKGTNPPVQTPPPDIATVVRDTLVGLREAEKQNQPAPQLTEEEFRKQFKIFNPTVELVKMLREGSDEDAVKALLQIAQGLSAQTQAFATHTISATEAKMLSRMTPIEQEIHHRNVETFTKNFWEEHKDLVGYEPVVSMVASQLEKEGFRGRSHKEISEKLAGATRETLKKIPGWTPSAPNLDNGGGGQTPPARQSTHKMSTLSSGGQGGSGDSRGNGGAKGPPGSELF